MFTSLFLHSFYIKRGKIYLVKINFDTLLQSFVCMFTAKQQSSKLYLNHVCHNTLLLNLTQIPAQIISFEQTYPSYRRSICRYLFNIQISLQHVDNSSICRCFDLHIIVRSADQIFFQSADQNSICRQLLDLEIFQCVKFSISLTSATFFQSESQIVNSGLNSYRSSVLFLSSFRMTSYHASINIEKEPFKTVTKALKKKQI